MYTIQACRDMIRKAKSLLGLNLVRYVKDKKGFSKYIGDKSKPGSFLLGGVAGRGG